MKGKAQGIILAGLLAALIAALTFVLLDRQTPSEIVIQPGAFLEIVVDVSGAVASPGVYDLPGASRLQQAIDRAGGLTADADVTSLNLAGRLGDGEHVVIPAKKSRTGVDARADAASVATAGATQGSREEGTPAPDAGDEPGSPINLNTASAEELDALPGVGPVIAGRVIEYRNVNGPFATIEELAEVQGISPAMVDEFRPLVTLGG